MESQKRNLNKQLLELKLREEQIRKERAFLRRQKPWYTSSSNIIGILTIIVTICISVLTIISNNDNKEITCSLTQPQPLTNFTPKLYKKLKINYNNIEVKNFGKINIKIENTGDIGLKRDDFVDGPIIFDIINLNNNGNSDSTLTEIPYLLDIVVLKNANQQSDILHISSMNCKSIFTYMPSLLNKHQSVEIEVYLSDVTNSQIDVSGNILDGAIKVIKTPNLNRISPLSNVFDSIINLLGSKWIAILLFSFLFLVSLINSIESILHDVVEIWWEYTLAVLFFVVDIFLLLVIIGLIVQ